MAATHRERETESERALQQERDLTKTKSLRLPQLDFLDKNFIFSMVTYALFTFSLDFSFFKTKNFY